MLKTAGSTICFKTEDSCVVYGMPQAVAKAGISTEDLPLDRIAERDLGWSWLSLGKSTWLFGVLQTKKVNCW